MKTLLTRIYVVLFICCAPLVINAQEYFLITGKLKIESGKIDGAKVTVHKDGVIERSKSLDRSGKFEFELDFNHTYIFSFTQDGYVTKKMSFDTKVPTDRMENGFYPFDFQVSLFPQFSDINTVIFDQPVGQIMFNPEIGDFDYDKDYTKSVLSQMQEVEQQINDRVKEEGKPKKEEPKEEKVEEKKEDVSEVVVEKKTENTTAKEAIRTEKALPQKRLDANMVVLQAYTVGEFNYPNLPAYGYINFGDGGGNREISKDEFLKYVKIYR